MFSSVDLVETLGVSEVGAPHFGVRGLALRPVDLLLSRLHQASKYRTGRNESLAAQNVTKDLSEPVVV